VIPKTNKKDQELTMFNHHRMICNNRTSEYLYDPAVGGKTGYTDEALNTLVTFAEKDGKRLVCIVLKAGMSYQYKESIELLEYGFNKFKHVNVAEKETRFDEEAIAGQLKEEGKDRYELLLSDIDPKAEILLPKDASITDAKAKLTFKEKDEKLSAVLSYTYAGQKIGSAKIKLYLDQKATAATDAPADSDEEIDSAQDVLNKVFQTGQTGVMSVKGWLDKLPFPLPIVIPIAVVVVIVLLIILLIRFGRRRKKGKKRRQMIEQRMGRSRKGPRW
jgi:D-alanyl-D-alanine carboxypeptidase